MASLTRQAVVVSAARLLNQGLMIISPLILVRLLSVDDFGLYREFLLYTTLVGNLAAFSLPNSLLYFVGREPAAAVTFVNRVVLGVATTSILACAGFVLLSTLLPDPLIDGRLLLCVAYVLLFANVDFWEFLWFAQKRPLAVFAYTSGRLAARIIVVISVAFATRDIDKILVALVLVEAIRLAVSVFFWRRMLRGGAATPARADWKEMLEFCVPSGLAVSVTVLSSSVSGMFVDQALGNAALAQLVIGGYVFGAIFTLRNAVSDVLLPEMVSKGELEPNGWLPVWKRSVVVLAIVLLPSAVLLGAYAEEFIELAFSEKYVGAQPIFLGYCVLIVLSCFDLALIYRAVNRTRAMLGATILTTIINFFVLAMMVPRFGLGGAAIAVVVSTLVGMSFAIWQLSRLLAMRAGEMLPLSALGKLVVATLVASPVLLMVDLGQRATMLEIAFSSALFLLLYAFAVKGLRIDEATWLLDLVRRKVRRS